ncbi:LptF/LptG family permease [Formicincola oecophyllae]|uniref:LptF/LptG family permease n=1 Tax=Formicincola oecophyllae TaxID=2558361 RepID=A0A4Y6U9G2_9PROT|nr:LptF/LptG family permease [Formicincola oecophyllae]QDH13096.1 LptF/LptG family permease [Formicincola oecophyllae]
MAPPPFPQQLHPRQAGSALWERCMFKNALWAFLALTGGACGLVGLTQSLRFLPPLLRHGFSLGDFLMIVIAMMPGFCVVIMPLALYLAVAGTWLRAEGDRELTILGSGGVSPLQLARPALALAGLVTATCYVLTLAGAPAGWHVFHQEQERVKSRLGAFMVEEGAFMRLAPQLSLMVQGHENGGFNDVMLDDGRNPNQLVTLLARHARLTTGPNGQPQIMLYDGVRQSVDPQTGRASELGFAHHALALAVPMRERSIEPAEYTMLSLLAELRHSPQPLSMNLMRKVGEGAHQKSPQGRLVAEFWHRVSAPLLAFSDAMLALLCVLKRPRRGRALKMSVLFGGVVAASLTMANLAFESHLASHPTWTGGSAMVLTALMPGLLCLAMLGKAGKPI